MLSKRNLAMMMTMIIVILVLFLSSVVLKEYYNDYDVNHMADSEIIERTFGKNATDDEASLQQQVLYFGAEKNDYYRVIKEWAGYRKRFFRAFSSIDKAEIESYMTDERLCLLIDGKLLENDTLEATETLTQYVKQGSVVIFYRLPAYKTIAGCRPLQKLLGIQHMRAESVKLKEIRLYSGFLLGGETHYSFENTNEPEVVDMESEVPWYDISSGTKTYMVGFITDEEKNSPILNNEDMPAIIWRNNIEDGSVFAVNGDYMKDSALGLLDAMLYESVEYALYSVVNAQNLSVTGFPDLTVENEKVMAETYGMTTEQFCRDILWPSIVAAANRDNWKITAFVSAKQSDKSQNEAKTNNLIDYLKYFNEASAEAGVSLGRIESSNIISSVKDETDILNTLNLNYLFAGGYVREENKDKLTSLIDESGQPEYFSDIRTVVGEYEKNQQILSWLTDKITLQNTTANAYTYSYKDSLRLKSLETSLGYSNVQADIYRIFWPKSEKDEWENLADKMAANIDTYWKPFAVFDKTTISQSDARVRNFLNGSVESSRNGDCISIQTKDFTGNAYILLRTHGEKPTKMTGGSWKQIEEDAYLLEITSKNAEITLKSKIEPYYK